MLFCKWINSNQRLNCVSASLKETHLTCLLFFASKSWQYDSKILDSYFDDFDNGCKTWIAFWCWGYEWFVGVYHFVTMWRRRFCQLLSQSAAIFHHFFSIVEVTIILVKNSECFQPCFCIFGHAWEWQSHQESLSYLAHVLQPICKIIIRYLLYKACTE